MEILLALMLLNVLVLALGCGPWWRRSSGPHGGLLAGERSRWPA